MAVRFRRPCGWGIAIVIAYLYLFPYFPAIQSANELPRVYLVKAIVDDHTFQIDKGVARWGTTFDVSKDVETGHSYSNKAPGSSLLAAPAYAVVKLAVGEPSLAVTVWLCRVVTGVAPTLLFAMLLWGFLARFAPDPALRRVVVIAYLFGSMALTYSVLFFSHQLTAVCLSSGWILAIDVAEARRGHRTMFAAGALTGFAVVCDYQAAFAVVPLMIDVVLRFERRDRWRAVAIGVVGAALPLAILLWYHAVCFGSPIRTGYNLSTTAHGHERGLLGMTTPTWVAFSGSTISPDNGLITLAPWLLVALPGVVTLARRDLLTALTCVAVMFVSVWFVSSIEFWRAGWEVGPRYIVMMLPFMLPLIAAQLEAWRERWELIALTSGLVVVGVVVYAGSAMTFPYWIEYVKNPIYELMFRLVGDDVVAPNLASAVGLHGVVSAIPFVALVGGMTAWSIQRAAGWRGLVVAVGVATAMLLAYSTFPRTPTQLDVKAYTYVKAAMTKL